MVKNNQKQSKWSQIVFLTVKNQKLVKQGQKRSTKFNGQKWAKKVKR